MDLFRGNDVFRGAVRQMVGHFKRLLRIEERLSVEEFYRLLELSEAITDYGRMIRAHHERSAPCVVVEVRELALRFREKLQTVRDALLLLEDMGSAEPLDLPGCWKLQLANTPLHGRKAVHSATRDALICDDDNCEDLVAT